MFEATLKAIEANIKSIEFSIDYGKKDIIAKQKYQSERENELKIAQQEYKDLKTKLGIKDEPVSLEKK